MKKAKLGFLSLTDCQGCEFVVLQLGEGLLNLGRDVDFASFRLASSKKASGPYDVFFIDGAVTTKEEEEVLRKLRTETKVLVALGSCAVDGGVNVVKNYLIEEGLNPTRLVYGSDVVVESGVARPLDAFVEVDCMIPGCPISLEEFEAFIKLLIRGETPKLERMRVCEDCRMRGVECVTTRGAFCAGPLTLGGCGAPCPAAGVPCFNCRGPLVNPNHGDWREMLKQRVKNGGLSFVWR